MARRAWLAGVKATGEGGAGIGQGTERRRTCRTRFARLGQAEGHQDLRLFQLPADRDVDHLLRVLDQSTTPIRSITTRRSSRGSATWGRQTSGRPPSRTGSRSSWRWARSWRSPPSSASEVPLSRSRWAHPTTRPASRGSPAGPAPRTGSPARPRRGRPPPRRHAGDALRRAARGADSAGRSSDSVP